ncbi:hypothetical protein MMC28_003822 [Mycoblastus sanguinarius]|nr:hypothetical protein [Mycoblastus sanguinarius]
MVDKGESEEEKSNVEEEKEPESKVCDHIYLVISPNPQHGNFIHAKSYENRVREQTFLEDFQQLHYMNFGDEVNLGARVKDYNTCNTQKYGIHVFQSATSANRDNSLVWLLYINFEEHEGINKKQGIATQVEDPNFNGFDRSISANEWVHIWNPTDVLRDLCTTLQEKRKKSQTVVKNKETCKEEAFNTLELKTRRTLQELLVGYGIPKELS